MTQSDYRARINRVLDYIEAHLDEELTLEQLAAVAHFSPYHFHRIFGAMMGETLGRFITRVRLGRAAAQLLQHPDRPVTTIALDVGFASPASFGHAFKAAFGLSAGQFRARHRGESNLDQPKDKHAQEHRKRAEAIEVAAELSSSVPFTQRWRITMTKENGSTLEADVEVREIEPMTVAYVRHIGPYAGDDKLFERLFGQVMRYAGPRDLIGPETTFISIYHDAPGITDEDKLRTSVGITVPEGTKGEGDVGIMEIPGGRYGVARFVLDPSQYGDAWQAVYGGWLPESGYAPGDSPPFETYPASPDEHPEGKHTVEIWIPVVPA